jgi:hypothetical protein
MPKIPGDQVSPYETSTDPVSVITTARPQRRARGESGAARVPPPLVALLSGTQTARYLGHQRRL